MFSKIPVPHTEPEYFHSSHLTADFSAASQIKLPHPLSFLFRFPFFSESSLCHTIHRCLKTFFLHPRKPPADILYKIVRQSVCIRRKTAFLQHLQQIAEDSRHALFPARRQQKSAPCCKQQNHSACHAKNCGKNLHYVQDCLKCL